MQGRSGQNVYTGNLSGIGTKQPTGFRSGKAPRRKTNALPGSGTEFLGGPDRRAGVAATAGLASVIGLSFETLEALISGLSRFVRQAALSETVERR